jgi:phosphatidylserine/phosphatidylglycerophosphate/cardiolipin synthase-like enzyme
MNAINGFGNYALPVETPFSAMQCAAKVEKVATALFFGMLTAASFLLIPFSLPLTLISLAAFSLLTIRAGLAAAGVFNRAPPIQLYPTIALSALPKLGELSPLPCSGFPTQDGIDSQKWKLELIRTAKHNIVLSGCYCGGQIFDETLELICERLKALPDLTVSILSSEIFITNENQKRIDALRAEFGARFSCVKTPEVFPHTSPVTGRLAMCCNHTKGLIIDYGAYFMLGGSGIHNGWSDQPGHTAPKEALGTKTLYDKLFGAKAFRDMDFVFRSPLNGTGTRLYVEFQTLIERFRHLTEGKTAPPGPLWPNTVDTPCPLFDAHPQRTENLRVACFATGPEQTENAFYREMIAQTHAAQESIVIGHMYFHPPKELCDALIEAANRGVRIILTTNKLMVKSPGAHIFFAELSRHKAHSLFQGRPNPHIEVYEHSVPHTTYHKKAIVFDGKVSLVGSSNIGRKSLDGSDYESNLKIESESFAKQLLASLTTDRAQAEKIAHPEKLPWRTHLCFPLQNLAIPFL